MKIYGDRRDAWERKKSEASQLAEKNKLAKAYVEWRSWIIDGPSSVSGRNMQPYRGGTHSRAVVPYQGLEDMSDTGGTQMLLSLRPKKSWKALEWWRRKGRWRCRRSPTTSTTRSKKKNYSLSDKRCYGLQVCTQPLLSLYWNLTSKVMVLGYGVIRTWWDHEDGAFMNGIRALIKSTRESSLTPSDLWGYSEKMAVSEEVGSHTPNLPGLEFGLPASRTVKNEFWFFINHSASGILL